jgi:coenzyme PQQ precursor peptide PqqA
MHMMDATMHGRIKSMHGRSESIALRQRRGSTTFCARAVFSGRAVEEEMIMAWTTPSLVEICIGLEINGYLPAEF